VGDKSFSFSFTRVEVDGKALEVRLEAISEQRNGRTDGPGRTIENLEPVDVGRTIFDSDYGIVPDCAVSGVLSRRTLPRRSTTEIQVVKLIVVRNVYLPKAS